MLVEGKTVAFLPRADLARAERFYVDVLGLPKKDRDDFGLVVDDIEQTARALVSNGVQFDRHAPMKQDASGIWTAPGGSRVAWFKDADGNVLSIAEHPGWAAAGRG